MGTQIKLSLVFSASSFFLCDTKEPREKKDTEICKADMNLYWLLEIFIITNKLDIRAIDKHKYSNSSLTSTYHLLCNSSSP